MGGQGPQHLQSVCMWWRGGKGPVTALRRSPGMDRQLAHVAAGSSKPSRLGGCPVWGQPGRGLCLSRPPTSLGCCVMGASG